MKILDLTKYFYLNDANLNKELCFEHLQYASDNDCLVYINGVYHQVNNDYSLSIRIISKEDAISWAVKYELYELANQFKNTK